MLAAQLVKYGGQDSVVINRDALKPTIRNDQLLIKVKAAAINPFDLIVREGQAQQMADLTFPATLGGDFAGTVEEIGADVTGFIIGQKVYGQAGALSGNGSFAEFTPVIYKQVQSSPPSLSAIEAAALPLVAVSAYQALVDIMNIQPDQKLLIHGGAGGIGTVAIQIAKSLGAYVATTVSEQDFEYVKQLGADEIIDYKSKNFSEILSDYDAVYDTVGGKITTDSIKVLKKGGLLVSMVTELDEDLLKEKNIKFTYQFTRITQHRLNAISDLVNKNKLKIKIDKIFDIRQVAEALEYQKTGHLKGKVVIKVSE